MYIGEVAQKTGLSIKAIRLYEERGLITLPPRKGRYRYYNSSHVEILNLIKEAKSLGSTLSQLEAVIVYDNGEVDWSKIEAFLIKLKCQLTLQAGILQERIERVDACLSAINSCPAILDSAPKGRD
ncbi:MerR family transcriptional regulator [Pseudoalteromonas umbrosa]|uniref:MerR family transcriptional regulator n=1 Tax=Pseudoalteromonas umbrosa TaxID=3048489 RepID=UPI0024C3CA8C|nr:MerR family transcriptional regulator [Pseudoalteromonas sp. B95]MDK1286876.1 MerR family transcriptional regulator [Pseudoalteromonas sp. B95]